jgi:hypothetical protein
LVLQQHAKVISTPAVNRETRSQTCNFRNKLIGKMSKPAATKPAAARRYEDDEFVAQTK